MSGRASQSQISGQKVTIRPVRSTDAEMESEFVRRLSSQTKRYRFLGGVRALSPDLTTKLCTVDGHRSMAFVATVDERGREIQIGVSRYAPDSRDDAREMAITVADEWRSAGLGIQLAEMLIAHAKQCGVKQLYSVDLADNAEMRSLAEELGMTIKRDPNDVHQVIYTLDL